MRPRPSVGFDVRTALGADFAPVSGHKLYGPKGTGCLYVRRGTAARAQIHGGGHESGLEVGHRTSQGSVGFGKAAEIERELKMAKRCRRSVHSLNDSSEVCASSTSVWRSFESPKPRLPKHSQRSVCRGRRGGGDGQRPIGTDLVRLGLHMRSIPDASHVLQAMGMSQDEAYECLRFSVGSPTTEAEIEAAVRRNSSSRKAGHASLPIAGDVE